MYVKLDKHPLLNYSRSEDFKAKGLRMRKFIEELPVEDSPYKNVLVDLIIDQVNQAHRDGFIEGFVAGAQDLLGKLKSSGIDN